jgi:imidazoleglycerol-phosphate dehydratase / histidinol-phosphatase
MKKVAFVDRDGTIIAEPPDTFQVDSLEKLEFLPYAISGLKKLADAGYELVLVSNQDGRGTDSFPEESFLLPHNKMLDILEKEGIVFAEQFIDDSFEHQNSPNRKPRLGMLTSYLSAGRIDLESSWVIGDRATDVIMARNIGCKALRIAEVKDPDADFTSSDWREIALHLTASPPRKVNLTRETSETSIRLGLNLDGQGKYSVSTGLKFYDHMLEQLSKHSGVDIELHAEGDLEIDEHHTIEDTAIALGTAFRQALGDKKGIERYGFYLPMDDALAYCALDFSGRSWLVFEGEFEREYVGDFPTEMVYHWLKSFSDSSGLNLHIRVTGDNTHHKIESIFKALARCIRQAVRVSGTSLPSTKGTL